MISRRTTLVLAQVYELFFNHAYDPEYRSDFFFEYGYPDLLCVILRGKNGKQLKEWIKDLHKGMGLIGGSREDPEQEGQDYLRKLAESILTRSEDRYDQRFPKTQLHFPMEELVRSLELDGYLWRDGHLLASEIDILDTSEEAGVLAKLYTDLKLRDRDVALHCLKLSEEHWVKEKWDDCISNARRFLECVLREVAAAHSLRTKGMALPQNTYERPVEIRDYLETEGVLEAREKRTIAEVYGLLSNTGSHPNIAEKDQARLLRQVALIFAQFVMLRFHGCALAAPSTAI